MRILPATLLAAALSVAGAPSYAATDTTQFNVRIKITSSCTISAIAAKDVNFADTASTATNNVDANGEVTAVCTALTPYSIGLNAGQNAATANDVNTRRMKHASATTNNFVAYQLYRDSARTLPWGSTTGTSGNVVTGTGNGASQAYPVYGRVANPSANNAAAGDYLDVVTATITY